MHGRIIKGIAGFYYVNTKEYGVIECKAKGIFRNRNVKPLVGDEVEIELLDADKKEGSITEICERRSELIRPAVANVDQAMVIFATKEPDPNLNLLDRFLIMMSKQKVDTIICFNKTDLGTKEDIELLKKTYEKCGYHLFFFSAIADESFEQLRALLKGKTTVLAGPSGVGKSTVMNLMSPLADMITGSVSEKIKRGKHTTRHSELFCLEEDTYLMDTPGFSTLYINEIDKYELKQYFWEFQEYEQDCRFNGCLHKNEPGCAVKAALERHEIHSGRYENYLQMITELEQQKKY